MTEFVDTLLQPISKLQKSYLSLKRQMWKTGHLVFFLFFFFHFLDFMSLDTNIPQNEGIKIVYKAYENFYKDNLLLHITCQKC